jgi:hypothetical protein
MNEIAVASNETMEQFLSTINEFNIQLSKNSLSANKNSIDLMMTIYKIQHIIFKSEAYTAVTNGKNRDNTLSTDHHNCAFGKWYDTTASKLFTGNKTFADIKQKHALFHEAIIQNIEFVNEGTDSLAAHKDIIFKNFAISEQMSQELFALMDKLVEETEGHVDLEKI